MLFAHVSKGFTSLEIAISSILSFASGEYPVLGISKASTPNAECWQIASWSLHGLTIFANLTR
ncbi:hypothetical protein PC116_g16188 [Phytophthora cactorum]|uniref:Uncharacterized protein n=1 Tax=Phytophthora aleatoria TaxID=2496075 RepID=A0A8J5M384_9STRA|nr:hypothetical protein Pcac1_g18679 [Phytophthora cactorum]KAG6949673.1 hypothetical protein JG688_00014530 [Phytophthora aleatoria]KAG2900844.1 hypothetical protein PC114_g13429 [Phytophthora cactorum]KAG3008385.1 hypothetical protein PC120_g16262 [Phytophthora cactorum]KAG3011105.1 hypothetical protein PC119_g13320 [Phytophthora cactorum]